MKTLNELREQFPRILSHTKTKVGVHTINYGVKGEPTPRAYATVTETPKKFHINMLHTEEEHRGKGYGSALLNHVAKMADKAQKPTTLHAFWQENLNNRRGSTYKLQQVGLRQFYRFHGFEDSPTPEDNIQMERKPKPNK